jgi:MFS family permease
MTEETKQDVSSDLKGMLARLESALDEYMVRKAPFALPAGVKEFIVNVSPYIVLVMAVVAIPVILAALGIMTILAPLAAMGGVHVGATGILSGLVSIVALAIELMAVPKLFARAKRGWELVFYASVLSLIGNLISFDIVGGIIGAIIGWYFLFQVKELYKN